MPKIAFDQPTSTQNVTSEIDAIAKRQAVCLEEADIFQKAISELARTKPDAFKEYIEAHSDQYMEVRIRKGQIVGYGEPHVWPGYFPDIGMNNFISNMADARRKECNRRSR